MRSRHAPALGLLVVAVAACQSNDLLPPPPGRPGATIITVFENGRARTMRAGWQENEAGLANAVSGLRCPYTVDSAAGPDDTLRLSTVTSYRSDGSDASCTYSAPRAGAVVTVYATIAPITGEAFLMDGETAISNRWPGAEPISVVEPDTPDFVGGTAYALPAGTNGKEYDRVSAIWVASDQGRHVKVRATYPAARSYAETQGVRLLTTAAQDVLLPD